MMRRKPDMDLAFRILGRILTLSGIVVVCGVLVVGSGLPTQPRAAAPSSGIAISRKPAVEKGHPGVMSPHGQSSEDEAREIVKDGDDYFNWRPETSSHLALSPTAVGAHG